MELVPGNHFTQEDPKPYQVPENQQVVVSNQQKTIDRLTAEIEKTAEGGTNAGS